MTKTKQCIEWIKDYYKDNPDGKAIIGISGGKDSTIAAALCVEALGADRVIGVMMPNGVQSDINDSIAVIKLLGIEPLKININQAYEGLIAGMTIGIDEGFAPLDETFAFIDSNPMVKTNLPARLRMTTLYAVAALYPNSRVVNTCNRSEDYVGYSTKYGDAAGDFSPLGNLTVREVLAIGDELGLPEHLVHKEPSDGMCGKTDEDNLGFTYEQLDDYILGTGAVDVETVAKIERLHKATRHKYQPMPMFSPDDFSAIPGQMRIDFGKPYRGLRAKIGIMNDCASGGVASPELMAGSMSGNIGGWTVDTLSSMSTYSDRDMEKVAEAIQKVINTAGCGLLKENK